MSKRSILQRQRQVCSTGHHTLLFTRSCLRSAVERWPGILDRWHMRTSSWKHNMRSKQQGVYRWMLFGEHCELFTQKKMLTVDSNMDGAETRMITAVLDVFLDAQLLPEPALILDLTDFVVLCVSFVSEACNMLIDSELRWRNLRSKWPIWWMLFAIWVSHRNLRIIILCLTSGIDTAVQRQIIVLFPVVARTAVLAQLHQRQLQ